MKRWNSVLLLPIQKIPEHFQLGEQTRVKTLSNNLHSPKTITAS